MRKSYILGLVTIATLTISWIERPKIFDYYNQLTKIREPLTEDLRDRSQLKASFVGSAKCMECHEEQFHSWKASRHSKMIQDVDKNSSVVVADFSKLPDDADFNLSEVVYTIGGKFKQRYMIPAKINGKDDFRLGNYQWNVETSKWQSFKPYKYWYHDAYPHDNKKFPTSNTCDGCHFTGYMSREKRVELSIGCESCHGAGSEHLKDRDDHIYRATDYDPIRSSEICLQCHMRNRDNRLKNGDRTINSLYMEAKDYPSGYEAGDALINYKLVAPFKLGVETKEFWANGSAKKNRTQGNEYVHDAMYAHGITCINCHDPHKLTNRADKSEGNSGCMKCHSFGSPIGPHQQSLEAHTHHKGDSKGSLCVECHMPKTGRHTKKSPLTVRSHRFKFTSPLETKIYNMPKETNACFSCHKDKSLDELQKSLEEWGTLDWGSMDSISEQIGNI